MKFRRVWIIVNIFWKVLADIQADNGIYYQSRQNINRDIRNNTALVAEMQKTYRKAIKLKSGKITTSEKNTEKSKKSGTITALSNEQKHLGKNYKNKG